jgi:hypothetical protein
MKLVLLIIAAWSTIWSTAAFFTGFESDFRVAATIAVACLAAVFYLDHRAAERERAAHARDTWRGIEDEYEIESLREVD